ncbi:MAG TPA: tRNA isopentenyl-2-thiomethyl-A-37 hydroxylase MiaE, partial [Planctomycetota bacterium]|nr:tRNA isopentenyl-2-thiomethyl-A-37 hydroxylase MiaE [Planctomycetota bacterium]
RTPPAWAEAALSDRAALLLDHRFCESKAAAMAHALARRHGEKLPAIVPLMRALAAEEDEHTLLCDRLLRELGGARRPHHGNPYVNELRLAGHRLGGGFLEHLLVAGTIEARSCERFRLLADACRGGPLGAFYEDLFASEARHHALFVNLAVELFGEKRALAKLEKLTAAEAAIIAARPWGPHIH